MFTHVLLAQSATAELDHLHRAIQDSDGVGETALHILPSQTELPRLRTMARVCLYTPNMREVRGIIHEIEAKQVFSSYDY